MLFGKYPETEQIGLRLKGKTILYQKINLPPGQLPGQSKKGGNCKLEDN